MGLSIKVSEAYNWFRNLQTFRPCIVFPVPTNSVEIKPVETWQAPLLSHVTRQVRRATIRANQKIIRARHRAIETIEHFPRTQAHNRKNAEDTFEQAQATRADVVGAQLHAWRSMLPSILKKLSRIPDPRRVTRVFSNIKMSLKG